jgi:hyperosmotically inducible periplasmic protein
MVWGDGFPPRIRTSSEPPQIPEDAMMLKRSLAPVFVFTSSLVLPVLATAADAADGPPIEDNQAITTAVKTRLAATRLDSLAALEVEADWDGTVWLSGTTPTEEAAERAVDIARNADGVMLVKSRINVEPRAR